MFEICFIFLMAKLNTCLLKVTRVRGNLGVLHYQVFQWGEEAICFDVEIYYFCIHLHLIGVNVTKQAVRLHTTRIIHSSSHVHLHLLKLTILKDWIYNVSWIQSVYADKLLWSPHFSNCFIFYDIPGLYCCQLPNPSWAFIKWDGWQLMLILI